MKQHSQKDYLECQCNKVLTVEPVIVHLIGCPTRVRDYAEYNSLKWYQKIFRVHPSKHYLKHFKV